VPDPVDPTERMPIPPPLNLGATLRDQEGSSTISDIETAELPPPHIDRARPGSTSQQRYTLESMVGRGATSQVFSANDLVFDRRIAIKFLVGSKADDPKQIGRFMREAKLTAALEHPNIAPIYDLDFTSEGGVYFSMRMITGTSLGDAVAQREEGKNQALIATSNDVVNILLRVCDAVSCAHGKGIVHRDIKPDNIMLGAFGEVMLVDWGSALVLSEDPAHQGRVIGTPFYMSPEQARGETADCRSDIYSLGATLFHVVTGRVPTSATDPVEFWRRKRAGEIALPTPQERGTCPTPLLDIAVKAMLPQAPQRYQTAAAMADDLRRWQAGLAISAHRDSTLEFAWRWHRRHWRGMWGSIAVLVAVLGSAALMYGERLKEIAQWGAPIATETFNDDSWQNRWKTVLGSYAVQDGALVATGEAGGMTYFQQRLGGGVAIEYEATMLPGQAGGDVSVIWGERELTELYSESEANSARIFVQIGAHDNSEVQIYDAGRPIFTKPMRMTVGQKYHIRVVIEAEHVTLAIDGQQVADCDLDIPTGMGYIGFYSYYAGKAFDSVRIYAKGVPERISALALGDDAMRDGLFKRAVEKYREVANAHAGKAIAEEALYRQGDALWRLGELDQAQAAWSRITNQQLRHQAEIQQLYKLAEKRDFSTLWARIRAIDDSDPSMRQRLALLWSWASNWLSGTVRAERETALALYDERFADSSAGISGAARLLASLDRNEEIIRRFWWMEQSCSPALIALGRIDDIIRMFPNSRGAWATVMISAGKFDEVLAAKPRIGWAVRSIEALRGKWMDYPMDDIKEPMEVGFFEGGKSQWIVDNLPQSGTRIRAYIFLDRLDEALAIPPSGRDQEFWHYLATALAGYEDRIVAGKQPTEEHYQAQILYWRAMRARARGDRDAALQLLSRIQLGDSTYGDRALGFTHVLLVDFLAFIDGNRQPFADRLADIAAHRSNIWEKRLWYYGEYIAGRLTDEQFMEQPVVLHRTGALAICRALRAEWEGRVTDAQQAYRAYLALPPHLRMVLLDERDPIIETFAAWRADALTHQR